MALTEFGIWASRRVLGEEGAAAARLLEATETLTVATSIANVWRCGAGEMTADWTALAAELIA